MRKIHKRLSALLLMLMLLISAACGINGDNLNNQNKNTADTLEDLTGASDKGSENISSDSQMEIHFMDVGQGDATLIICDGEAMMFDCGDNNKGTLVRNYLSRMGVKRLKYVIGSHPDADHIGGMDVVIYNFDCDAIIMPDDKKDTKTYRDVIDTMKNRGYKNTLPKVGDTYKLGSAEFTIVGPNKKYSSSNDNSVAIVLKHGGNSFLFTGDAEDAEEDIIRCGISIDVDVYKVGHHGSSSASCKELLDAATPEYAVISCGEDNSYGHPHAEVMNNLRARGIKVFRTDEQGTIVVKSDGMKLVWNMSPSDSWLTN